MNAKLLSERTNELAVFLQDDSVAVKSVNGRIKVYPTTYDGELAPLNPIFEPTIKRIVEFCSIKNLCFYVALDIIPENICFTIYESDFR